MSALKAMIKRELQEHKWGFIYLPWIIGAFMSLVVVLVYLGLTEVNTENIKFSTDVFDNQETVQAMNEATFDQKRAAMRAGLLVLGFPLAQKLGVSFGMLPFSSTGYEMSDNLVDLNDPSNQAIANYYGDGGISKIYFGSGYELFKGFSLGVNASYLFVGLNRRKELLYNDESFLNSRANSKINLKGYLWNLSC